jgi:hypothetical protein
MGRYILHTMASKMVEHTNRYLVSDKENKVFVFQQRCSYRSILHFIPRCKSCLWSLRTTTLQKTFHMQP